MGREGLGKQTELMNKGKTAIPSVSRGQPARLGLGLGSPIGLSSSWEVPGCTRRSERRLGGRMRTEHSQ